jgi:signal transduction histidine kinase
VLRVAADGNFVRVEIEDNGPGMPPEVCKRIFEPFYTTKSVGVGTGLGLSVSYFIITENHGGRLTVISAPGAGGRFVILLPVKRGPSAGRAQ